MCGRYGFLFLRRTLLRIIAEKIANSSLIYLKFDTASSGIKREKDDSDEEVTIIPQSQLRPDQLKSIKPDPESPALQQSFKLEGGNHNRGPHYRHREREGRWRSRSRSPSPRRKRHSRLPRHIISDAHMLNTYVISSTHTL